MSNILASFIHRAPVSPAPSCIKHAAFDVLSKASLHLDFPQLRTVIVQSWMLKYAPCPTLQEVALQEFFLSSGKSMKELLKLQHFVAFVPFCTILYHFVPKLYGGWFEWDENDVPWNPTYFVSKLLHSSEWCTVHNVISTTFRHLVEPMLNRLGPSPRFFAHGKHSDDFVFLCFSLVFPVLFICWCIYALMYWRMKIVKRKFQVRARAKETRATRNRIPKLLINFICMHLGQEKGYAHYGAPDFIA